VQLSAAHALGVDYLAQSDPGSGAAVAEGGRERAEVGDDAGGDEHVSEQVVVDGLQVGGRLVPAVLLAAQSADQLLGAHQLLSTDRHLQQRHRARPSQIGLLP